MTQREHIISEVTGMFVRDGLRSIRMDDIAERLRVSKRTLYELFGDKQALIEECVMHYHRTVLERVGQATRSVDNVLEETMLMLYVWDSQIEYSYKLKRDLRKFYPAILKRIEEKERSEGLPMFLAKLNEGVRQGLIIEYVDLDMAISTFERIVRSLMNDLDETPYDGDMSKLKLFRYVMAYFLRSISTERGMKIIDKYLKEEE